MSIYQTLKFILNHPLNHDNKVSAMRRFIGWQVGGRLVPGPVAVPFVNSSRLLVQPGMTGATGNVYCGLHEFEDMAFVLHLLRREDLFVDVGANIGSYTVLAGAVVGARCISFEPLPDTYRHLQRNICLNDIKERVQALNIGIGREDGVLRFTVGLDTVNHVANRDEIDHGTTLEVRAASLDNALCDVLPKLIKIDVEGFEAEVIAGADRILSNDNLDAVIMELSGSGIRYGFDETMIHQHMLDYGFNTFTYSPFDRVLIQLGGQKSRAANTLYLRNVDRVKERLENSLKFHILNHSV
jgi:FkbM family methyltransferase